MRIEEGARQKLVLLMNQRDDHARILGMYELEMHVLRSEGLNRVRAAAGTVKERLLFTQIGANAYGLEMKRMQEIGVIQSLTQQQAALGEETLRDAGADLDAGEHTVDLDTGIVKRLLDGAWVEV